MNKVIACLLFPVFLLSSAHAMAGPEEDYKEGSRLYLKLGDVVTSLELLKRAADSGHVDAMVLVAQIYFGATDYQQALKYNEKLVEKNHPEGYFNLGTMYASGDGVKQDHKKALELLTKSAQMNYSPAVVVLAHAYILGNMGLKNLDDAGRQAAMMWIDQAIKGKDQKTFVFMAKAYAEGDDRLKINKDLDRAVDTLRKAADLEFAFAYEALANAYRNGELGLKQSKSDARKWEDKYFKKTGKKIQRKTEKVEKTEVPKATVTSMQP